MTHNEMLELAIDHLVILGNTEEEAIDIMAKLLHDATMSLPQRCWHGKYADECRIRKNNAICRLRKLPNGDEILKQEEKIRYSY